MVNLNQPDNDGVDEFFNEQVRVGIGVLSQVAMVAQRAREVAERQREAAERAETEQLRERMAAEREAAHAVMNNTRTPGWWEQATPQEVGRTYAVAHAWAEAGDPLAQLTRENMHNTIQARYGMSPEALQAMVREAELERDRDLSDADRVERRASTERTSEQRGEAEVGVATALDGAQDARRDAAYDSAERREAFAERLRNEGVDDQLVADRLRSDMSQGRPAAEAVQHRGAARARKGRPQAAQQVRHVARGR